MSLGRHIPFGSASIIHGPNNIAGDIEICSGSGGISLKFSNNASLVIEGIKSLRKLLVCFSRNINPKCKPFSNKVSSVNLSIS